MPHSPESLTRRRRARVMRRRARLVIVPAALFLAGGGVGAYLLNRTHHVVVVQTATVHAPPRAVVKSSTPEYPAAAGAQSLKSVRAALATIHHRNHASSAGSTGSGASGSALDSDALSSFQQLTASMPGHIELAVTPLGAGETTTLGGNEAAPGWSTTKVPVLVSLLRARGTRGLTGQEQTWAQSAITESSNESVLSLFDDLEQLKGGLGGASQYVGEVLRLGGDAQTAVATAPPPAGAVTTFGQTEWAPDEAVSFFRSLALGCLLPSSQTSYVLGLMENIEPGESWGLGSAGFSSVAFKGGWGPEASGYLVRQSGIIDPASTSGIAVAIVAFAPSFATGTEMLTRTASWLNHHLQWSARRSADCSG